MNAVRSSAAPSPSASRSRVIRFALGTPDPARFITRFINHARTPFESSGAS